MYLYQPCLLTLSLHAWAFGRESRLRILLPLAVLAVSEWELLYTQIWLYPAAMLLPLPFLLGRARAVAWAEVWTASLLGGAVSWKAADLWPLLPGSTLLCAALLLVPAIFLCRSREDKLLACALGSLFFELFFCLREYILFSFCVIRLGSREALSLGAAALCLYHALEQARRVVRIREKRAVSMRN